MSFVVGIVNLFRFDKTNWRAVALCLVAATVFWFFNALNKEHTATISIPVDFKYNESTYIPVQELPRHVLINITGIGWDVLRRSVGFKVDPLKIALERPSDIKKIPPGSILALATAQFDQLKINHIASDTLNISIDKRLSKKVKLYLPLDQLKFKNDFGRSGGITINPDSVLLSGPSSMINQMKDSIQLKIPGENIDENFNAELDIDLSNYDHIVMSSETARVRFRVNELIIHPKKIKIVVFPAPPFRHQLSSDSVMVYFRLPNNLIDSLDRTDVFGIIDLRTLDPGSTKTAPLIKRSFPFSTVMSIDSITVRKF